MQSDTNKSGHDYPVPKISYSKDPDDVTIGIFKGQLTDQRPFVADIWWWDGFVGVTYRFSKIDLENATEDDIVKLLEGSGQIKPVNSKTHHLVSGLIDLKDIAGNDVWNISIHLGMADRITVKDSDGVNRAFVLNDIKDKDGGPPPMMEILEPSIDTLIMALIIIQVLDNMPPEHRGGFYNSLAKELQEYIQELKAS